MTNLLIKFIKNKKGSLSLEFAAAFIVFSLLLMIVYDVYCSIMLQNKLERATYSVASIFRERSSLYPITDDSQIGNIAGDASICSWSNGKSCYKSNEYTTQEQVNQAQALAKALLNKNVAIRVDTLFIVQDPNNVGDMQFSRRFSNTFTACTDGTCNDEINNYFAQLPNMATQSPSTNSDYTKLVPYVPRDSSSLTDSHVNGRWVPLYRISMCIENEESLYLRAFGRNRLDSTVFPNLCHEVAVISRCNDLENATESCPIYVY